MNTLLFREIFENHNAIMLLIDPPSGQIMMTNQAAQRFYGYRALEFNNLKVYDLSTLSTEEMNRRRQVALEKQENFFITPHRLASGEVRTVEVHLSPIRWQNQTLLFAIIYDVTEREELRQALQESEQKLKTLLALLPIGVSVLNNENKIVYMNPALENILQISPEGLRRGEHQQRTYLHGDGSLMPASEFATSRALVEQEAVYNVETGVVVADDQIVWTNVSAVPVTFSDWRLIIVTNSITERKQAEAALQKKEAKYFLTELFEAIPAPIFYKDISGHYLACNQAFAALSGKQITEIVGQTALEVFPEAVALKYQAMDVALLAEPHAPQIYEHTVYHPTWQEERIMLVTKSVIQNIHLQPTGIVGFMTDITARKRAEVEIQQQLQFFQFLFEKHGAIMMLTEPANGQIIGVNHAASRFYGYSVAQMSAMNMQQVSLLPEAEVIELQLAAKRKERNHFIVPHRLASGEIRTVEVYASPIQWNNELVLFSIVHDITARQQAEEALRVSEERWQFALEGSGDGVWEWNVQTNEVLLSRQWKEFLGYRDDEIGNDFKEWEKRVHPDDLALINESLAAHLRGETASHITEQRTLHRDGSYRWIMGRGKVMSWTADGQPLRMLGTHSDITERKKLEAEVHEAHLKMQELATHDLLTGLYNRVLLMEKLTQALNGCGRDIVAILTIDMDGFKQINDTYGHHEGDIVLIEVAARMKNLLRESDTLIRLGGDEFMLIAPGVESITQIEAIANRLLDAVQQQIKLTNVSISPTFSVGIALCPKDGTNPETLMVNSDNALYEAKHKGRNCYAFA